MNAYYADQGTEIPLYDGMPVTVTWDGEYFLWRPTHVSDPPTPIVRNTNGH